MTLLVQLSDLHFGSEDPKVARALLDEVNAAKADLAILSGDLTMAARTSEFERAAAFIDGLAAPVLAIPGNHDITPYKILERLVRPYARWTRHIGQNLEPQWEGEDVSVIGLNTARRMRLGLDWSHGSVSRRQIRDLGGRFQSSRARFRIAAAHHPFLDEVGVDLSDRPRSIVRRAQGALDAFAEARVDLVVAGHLHRTYTASYTEAPGDIHAAQAVDGGHRVTVVQAGTALSSRTRNEVNSFNRIEIEGRTLSVHPVTWTGDAWVRAEAPLVVLQKPGTNHGR